MFNPGPLNPQQREAVQKVDGPVLILAGAGTGKTRVITSRIAYMVDRGISPGEILAVTFTNKAAREMQERVRKMIPRNFASPGTQSDEKPARPTICTFHSLCVRILRQHIDKLGYKRNFVIYDESEQLAAMKKILANISAKGEKLDAGEILSMLSRFKNGGERAGFGDESVKAMATHLQGRYESALRACNAVDFDDLILLTLRLFNEHPEALAACRQKFRYVMVDEYQDTNAAQFKLVNALTSEHRNLCVVGDDDQSIYGWRGAEISNLLDMEQHYPEVKVIKLEQNYRSTATILNAANAIIRNNVRRRGKTLWSAKGAGAKITLHAFENEEEEAKSIAEKIEDLRMTHRVPWSQQAILFRTNIQSRPLETALRQASIRYHLIGGQSFFDRREVRDFLAYLKIAINPNDDVSLLRVANTPPRGLSDTTMERLLQASQERKCSVFSAMKNPLVTTALPSRARESIESFVAFIDSTAAKLAKAQPGIAGVPRPVEAWANAFLNEIGYFVDLQRAEKTPEAAENRIRNIKELMTTLDDVDHSHAGSTPAERLGTFLDELALDNKREEENEDAGEAVTMITMHSCKGLEYPHVYIVGLEDGLLPHTRSKTEGTIDEERRLFYVAITRAMLSLTISHCGARKKYGGLVPCHPSPFLKELPEELIQDGDEMAAQPVSVESGASRFHSLRASL
jgi:superfamily I DNA/RNA helicase